MSKPPPKNKVISLFNSLFNGFFLKFKGFMDSYFLDSFFAAGWFVLPSLFVFRFGSFYFFWGWLFCTMWVVCFAFAYVLDNPAYRQGSLIDGIDKVAKNLYKSKLKR